MVSTTHATTATSTSSPLTPQLLTLLARFTALSQQLFSLLSTPLNTPTSSSSGITASREAQLSGLYDSLREVDQQLARACEVAAQHRRKQARVRELVTKLEAGEAAIQRGLKALEACRTGLGPLVAQGSLDLDRIAQASSAPLRPEVLLAYAKLLAPFTAAPPASVFPRPEALNELDPTGVSLPQGAVPPFPTEGVMRRGRLQLWGEGEGMGGLGETQEVGAMTEGHDRLHSGAGAADSKISKDAAVVVGKEDSRAALAKLAAKQQQSQKQPEEEEEDFMLDFELNPDL